MATHLTPALRADLTYSVPIKRDRFARQDERSQRTQPLMRKFEIASLLSDGSVRSSHHLAPASEVFEATSSAFARGVLIATPAGPVAIEDLWPGDLVDVAGEVPQKILWIGSTTFVPAQTSAATTLTHLTRVLSDGDGSHLAFGDVLLGPSARLLQSRSALEQSIGVRSVLTPARDMEDGHTILQIIPPSPVRLYHLRLENHAIIRAGGRPVETYHPGRGVADHMGESSRALFLSMFPGVNRFDDFGPLCAPRMSRETLESLLGY